MDLHPELQKKLDQYRAKRNFSEQQWLDNKVEKFVKFLHDENIKKVVLPVSGGIDSALSAMILGYTHKRYPDVLVDYCICSIPIYSSSWATERAMELADTLNKKLHVIDLSSTFDLLNHNINDSVGSVGTVFTEGQTKSYLRPVVAYTIAQNMSLDGNLTVVMGTGNMDEDGYLAYFCKAGDGVCDFQLIWDLHKSEVFKVAKYMGVPNSIINAKPSADLWEGQEDEDELGISYDFIELFTGYYLKLDNTEKTNFVSNLGGGREQFIDFSKKAISIHQKNKHKLEGIKNI